MPSMNYLGLASAILSLTTAAPFGDRAVRVRDGASSNTFSVSQSIPKSFKSGPAAMAGVYRKYGKNMPADVAAASSDDGTGTATPTQYDSSYLVPVNVGGSTLNLDFDTGSSDLWVFSAELPSSDQSGHSIYQPSSSGQKISGASWSISYGDGSSASGDVYTDTVSVGTATVTDQAVEAASTISAEFVQDTDTDGLLGLAFDSLNTVKPTQQKTFISNALDNLDAPVFTADLKKGAPGTYDFGFIDSSKYTGDITYVPVSTSQGFWEFTADGYAVGTGQVSSTSIDGIADTGTTLLLLDDSIVSDYYGQVDGASYDSSQGGYTFACSATLPDFTAVIGGYNAVIPGSFLNYAPVDSSNCFGGLQSNSGVGISIFGDIFLKSQFIVFDRSVPQLGVAAKDL